VRVTPFFLSVVSRNSVFDFWNRIRVWPSQDIVIANIVWYMAYKEGVGWGAYIAHAKACNSIATGQALQVGGGNKRMIDSRNKALK